MRILWVREYLERVGGVRDRPESPAALGFPWQLNKLKPSKSLSRHRESPDLCSTFKQNARPKCSWTWKKAAAGSQWRAQRVATKWRTSVGGRLPVDDLSPVLKLPFKEPVPCRATERSKKLPLKGLGSVAFLRCSLPFAAFWMLPFAASRKSSEKLLKLE